MSRYDGQMGALGMGERVDWRDMMSVGVMGTGPWSDPTQHKEKPMSKYEKVLHEVQCRCAAYNIGDIDAVRVECVSGGSRCLWCEVRHAGVQPILVAVGQNQSAAWFCTDMRACDARRKAKLAADEQAREDSVKDVVLP